MSTSDAPNLRRLARQLADYGRRLRHLETVPQLSNSSLDDHGMPVYDADGNLSVTLGKQSDGTYSARPVRGPIPPAPAGLDAEGDAGLVHASWQGVFWAGAAFPRDFEAVEVLVDGNVHGAIHDPDGGSVTVPAFAGERVVSFRTLSQAGRRSDATGHVTVTVQSKASVQLDEARGRIEDAEVSLGETQVRLDQAEQTVASTAEDLTRVETVVIPGAVAELEAADSALWDARDALESDIDAVRTSANGKNTVHWSTSTPPNEYDGVTDDTWFRMSSMGSGGRVVSQWRWNGEVWVSTVVDNAVIANLDAGKITSGFIDAERFKAGSIAASSIAVGDFSNLATIDPIRDVNVSRPSNWATETVGGYITPKASSQNYLMFKDRTDTVPFKGGDRLRIEFKAVAEVDGDALIRLWGYPDVADGSTSGLVGVSGDIVHIGTTEQSFAAYVTIPDSFGVSTVLRSWIFGLGSYGGTDLHQVGVRDVTAYRMTGATLIEDGAVTTDKLLAGAVTAEKITVTEALSANIVDAMTVNTKKLVVTEEAILNHATLIGDTVVDNINVTGKLIGTDGVFTGTVDFENVNVTGLQIVEKLEANSISADKIEGGHFTGETFEGGSFVGGEFRTSDNLPGQVRLADDAYVTHLDGGGVFPGLRVTPADASDFSHLPAIGPGEHGLTIYGGRRTGGGSSIVQANPTESFMRTFHAGGGAAGEIQTSSTESYMRTYRGDGATGGEIETSPTVSLMRTYREDGTTGGQIQTFPHQSNVRTYSGNSSESGWVRVQPQDAELAYVDPNNTYFSRIKADANEAFIYTRAGGKSRYLTIDANGVWVKESGWEDIDLTAPFRSKWVTLSYPSRYTRPHGAPLAYYRVGKRVYWRGRFAKTNGTPFKAGEHTPLLTLSQAFRPEYTTGLSTPSSGTSLTRIEVSSGSGEITATPNANTSWVSIDGLAYDLP